MEGMGQFKPDGGPETISMWMSFEDFFEMEPSTDWFQPTSDLYCKGRKLPEKLEPLPTTFFEYTSEVIFHWKYEHEGDEAMEVDVLCPRQVR